MYISKVISSLEKYISIKIVIMSFIIYFVIFCIGFIFKFVYLHYILKLYIMYIIYFLNTFVLIPQLFFLVLRLIHTQKYRVVIDLQSYYLEKHISIYY